MPSVRDSAPLELIAVDDRLTDMGLALLRYVLDPDVVRVLRVVTAEAYRFPELNQMIESRPHKASPPLSSGYWKKRSSSAVSNCKTFHLRRHYC